MKTFTFTLKHDGGKYKLSVYARSYESAKETVLKAENCPECAIIKYTEVETMYKVFKLFRVSRRREILARYLNEDAARAMVNSYPDSSRSMVCYTKQFCA